MSCSLKKILNIKIRHRAIFIQDFEDQKIAQTVSLHRFLKYYLKKVFSLLKTFLLTKDKNAAYHTALLKIIQKFVKLS